MNFFQRIQPLKPALLNVNIENLPGWKRFVNKVWNVAPNTTPKYKHELYCIQQALDDVSVIEKVPYNTPVFNELETVTTLLRQKISERLELPSQTKLLTPSPIFKLIDEILTEEIQKYPIPEKLSVELARAKEETPETAKQLAASPAPLSTAVSVQYRLQLTKNYFQSLDKLYSSEDLAVNSDNNQQNIFPFIPFVECLLLGTSSERIQQHLLLFGPKVNQEKLIIAMHALYEPELQTTVNFLKKYPFQWKKHNKLIPKLSNAYLLDKIELNTKARCILAWSDPNYSGFKPLDDDFELSIQEIVKGRQRFFQEGGRVGKEFLTHMKATIEELEENKRENKQTLKRGFVFFIITCFADYFVCVM